MAESMIVVIFGGSGDLTKRKLMMALYQLYVSDRMPEQFAVVGTARSMYSDAKYREIIAEKLREQLPGDAYDESKVEGFLSHLRYYPMNPEDGKGYEGLKDYLSTVDSEIGGKGNYLFYLATPPSLYGQIPQHLHDVGLHDESEGVRRIIVEKPFGFGLESARELNSIYERCFHESQVYRIDHFLGKETAQNIMALRFANGIFEPLWNRNYISHIEITAVENLGIGTRGSFYDKVGALRDMVQNHLIQLLALTAMEPPALFNADTFRNEVVKVYESLRPIPIDQINKFVVRGQYTSSVVKGEKLLGYREEDKVSEDSRTETYLAMKLYVDNWRWGGVPFYIRTGKQMPTKVTEIVVHFKDTPHKLFLTQDKSSVANTLTIRIQPNEGAVLKFGVKKPGPGFEVQQVSMDFSYSKLGGVPDSDAYSRLIEDAMKGDPTLFTRYDAMDASWRFFDPILKAWEDNPSIPLYGYPARTWGPKKAGKLLGEMRDWSNPCKNLTDTDLYCEL